MTIDQFNDMLIKKGVWDRIVALEEGLKNLQSVKERNQTLENANATLQKTGEEQAKEIERLNGEIDKQKVAISNLTQKKTESEKALNELTQANAALDAANKSLEKANAEKESKNDELTKANFTLLQDKKQLEEDVKGLIEEKTTLESAKQALEARNAEQAREIEQWKGEISRLGKEREESEKALNETITTLEQQNDELDQLDQSKKSLEKELKDLKKEKQELEQISEQQRNDWNDHVAKYKEMLLLLYQCPALETLVTAYGMKVEKKGEDFQSIIQFVSMLGNGTTFATNLLYDAYTSVKKPKTERKPLDGNDYQFLDALNSYYRKTYGLKFDVLWYPKEDETKFDKDMMRDIDDTENYRSFSEVYVPAVMRNAKDPEKRMLVKGE